MMTAKRKKKPKKQEGTPPFVSEELLTIGDPRFGNGREAVFEPQDLEQVGDYSSVSEEIHPGMVEVPFQTSSGRTLYILFMQEKMKTSLFGVSGQWLPGVEIMFYDKSQEGEALVELSKKGEAFEVLRTTLAHTQQYLQKNPSLPIVTFTAANDEKSRVSLYQVMARKFAGHEPEVTQDAKATRFTVKNPHYEGTVRISRRERIARGIRAVRKELLTREGLESADIPEVDFEKLQLDPDSLQERVPFKTSSGREFTVLFRMGKRTSEHGLDEMPVVEVGLMDDAGKMEITGGGEAVQIIQKALAIIDGYLQSNQDFPFVVFSSLEDERGRRRLYRKIAESFAPNGIFMEEQDGPYRTFVIRNPYAELDEHGEPWSLDERG